MKSSVYLVPNLSQISLVKSINQSINQSINDEKSKENLNQICYFIQETQCLFSISD
jgi:hypothetical protein